MEYKFHKYHDGRLVNVIVTFLRKNNINPIPLLSPGEKKIVFSSSTLTISFSCQKYNRGSYEVLQVFRGNLISTITPVFTYYDGR